MRLPNGKIFMNEVKEKYCIAITDNPQADEIEYYFKIYNAEKLIYINGEIKKEYYSKGGNGFEVEVSREERA